MSKLCTINQVHNHTNGDAGCTSNCPLWKPPSSAGATGIPNKNWNVEQVSSWLQSYRNGKFDKTVLRTADGEDLFRFDKEDFIRVLGEIKGPSLYSLLHKSDVVTAPQISGRLELDGFKPWNGDEQFAILPNIGASGLESPSSVFYVRRQSAILWKELTNKNRNIFVTGPPGSGKSSLVWAYCIFASSNQIVLWIHIYRLGNYQFTVLKDGCFQSYILDSMPSLDQEGVLVVVDGVTRKTQTGVLGSVSSWFLKSREKNRFILVSSLGLTLAQEDYQVLHLHVLYTYGWTMDEYKEACSHEEFYNSVKKNLSNNALSKDEALCEKEHLAGHSARWFFGFTVEQTKSDIATFVGHTTDCNILDGTASDSEVVNHLVTRLEGNEKCVVVSKFVLQCLTKKWGAEFITIATNYSNALKVRNGAFDGWIFQFDFLQRVEAKEKIPMIFGTKVEQWEFTKCIDYTNLTDLDAVGLKKEIDGVALIPQNVQQGCFDLLQLFPSQNLCRAIQLTVGEGHGLLMRYVVEVLDHLEWAKTLDVVVVVPSTEVQAITGGKVNVPEKSDTLTKLDWDGKKVRIGGYTRRAAGPKRLRQTRAVSEPNWKISSGGDYKPEDDLVDLDEVGMKGLGKNRGGTGKVERRKGGKRRRI
eukprot:TRINITY_DN10942_c0_g1_i6.p1 TRINITY_DN10942_c0_g1~~TRINITY_DN10942_c0_g1_i6.p1  ORF type:complete len:642 (-),score=100.40 TRINITY_DN10942_c0_g1_i6:126-2051(-)